MAESTKTAAGRIARVTGPVVDIEFPHDAIPDIYNALTTEVTLGGVDTDTLDARTFEARTQPGLHFIGEVVDVTGWLGGYNFQWAWSSGWAAGQVA